MEEIGYQKEYKIKILVKGKMSFNVTIPPQVVIREARKRSLTINEFIDRYVAVSEYDNFEGIRYTFKENERKVVNKK